MRQDISVCPRPDIAGGLRWTLSSFASWRGNARALKIMNCSNDQINLETFERFVYIRPIRNWDLRFFIPRLAPSNPWPNLLLTPPVLPESSARFPKLAHRDFHQFGNEISIIVTPTLQLTTSAGLTLLLTWDCQDSQ